MLAHELGNLPGIGLLSNSGFVLMHVLHGLSGWTGLVLSLGSLGVSPGMACSCQRRGSKIPNLASTVPSVCSSVLTPHSRSSHLCASTAKLACSRLRSELRNTHVVSLHLPQFLTSAGSDRAFQHCCFKLDAYLGGRWQLDGEKKFDRAGVSQTHVPTIKAANL